MEKKRKQTYKDLEIYKVSHKLAVEVHEMTFDLPSFEKFEEGGQIRRSSKSIVSNIAEGFGRKNYKMDYVRFISYSHASCNETIEHLELLFKTKSLRDKRQFEYLLDKYNMLGCMINKFLQALNKPITHNP